MHRSLKRNLVIGLAALAVAALAGGAYAATQSSAPNTRQAFLNDVAKRLHVTPQQLAQALNGATLDQLHAAVKAGRLTQAQADKLAQGLKRSGSAPFGFGFGPAPRFVHPPGPGFPGGPGFFGGRPGGPFELPAAASYLGLTSAQLFQQLSSGKSLAQIAVSRGKTASGLEQAMINSIKTRLDKLVANKMMTAAQEKTVLSRLSAKLSTVINQKGLMTFKGPRFRFRYGAPAAPNAPAPKGPNAPAPTGPNAPAPVPPAYAPAPAAPPVA